jgi:hypothetical protein
MKIPPVEADLFHAEGRIDRRTDRHEEANSRCLQFLNAPKNGLFLNSKFMSFVMRFHSTGKNSLSDISWTAQTQKTG